MFELPLLHRVCNSRYVDNIYSNLLRQYLKSYISVFLSLPLLPLFLK